MSFFCIGTAPKSGLARDLGDRLQSRNVPFGTSGDYAIEKFDFLWHRSLREDAHAASRKFK